MRINFLLGRPMHRSSDLLLELFPHFVCCLLADWETLIYVDRWIQFYWWFALLFLSCGFWISQVVCAAHAVSELRSGCGRRSEWRCSGSAIFEQVRRQWFRLTSRVIHLPHVLSIGLRYSILNFLNFLHRGLSIVWRDVGPQKIYSMYTLWYGLTLRPRCKRWYLWI